MEETSTAAAAGTVTTLMRREIEVEVAHAYRSVLAERFGEAAAESVSREAVSRLASSAAAAGRRTHPSPGFQELWEMWQEWAAEGSLEIRLHELGPTRLRFHVGRCAFAEMYRDLDRTRTGFELSCGRDAPFAAQLIPGVRMERSETILEGAPRCEFIYTLEGP